MPKEEAKGQEDGEMEGDSDDDKSVEFVDDDLIDEMDFSDEAGESDDFKTMNESEIGD